MDGIPTEYGEPIMELLDYLCGFFTGATLAFVIVMIMECRDIRKRLKEWGDSL